MKDYIEKKSTVRRNEFVERKSFSPHNYRSIHFVNKNVFPLSEFLEENQKGFEPGSNSYIKFTENHFIRIGELSDEELSFNIKPSTLKIKPPEKNRKTLKYGDICYQTASNVGNVCVYEGPEAYFNSHIRKLSFKKHKFYIFSLLKSSFGRNQVEVGGSIKGVDNFQKDMLNNTLIVLPNEKNYKTPDLLIEYIENITQNILHKEDMIRTKVSSINKIFKDELSRAEKKFNYKYPTKEEVLKKEKRLDTGLYTQRYKKILQNIKDYPNGYFQLGEMSSEWVSGSTPSISYKTNSKEDTMWIAVADIDYGLKYKRLNLFKVSDDINELKDGDILITRKGATVGKMIIYYNPWNGRAFVNEDLKVLRLNETDSKKIFIGLFLNSEFGQAQLLSNGSKGTKQGLTNPNILSTLIPNINTELTDKLAKLYFNPLPTNENLNARTYLTREKQRNEKLGLSNLNLECFVLKEHLEIILDDIIKDKQVKFSY